MHGLNIVVPSMLLFVIVADCLLLVVGIKKIHGQSLGFVIGKR